LNLVGILTPGDTVSAITSNRVLYRDGVPVVVKEAEGKERFLVEVPAEERDVLRAALMRRRPAPLVRSYMGKSRAG
jgi:ATP-dependent Lhr-like helicase